MTAELDASRRAEVTAVSNHGRGLAFLHLLLSAPVLLATGSVVLAVTLYRNRDFQPDDPMISLRYARNLVQHGELVWNLGERVEGYTNFFHLMLTAGLMKLGAAPFAALGVVNVLATALLLACCWLGMRHVLVEGRSTLPAGIDAVAAAGLLVVMASAPLALWTIGGLEPVLVAALHMAGLVCLLQARADARRTGLPWLAGLCFGAAVLTRPDAVLIVGACLGGWMLIGPGGWPARLSSIWRPVALAGVIVLTHLAWRYSYYGEWVPNTFFAKIGIPAAVRIPNALGYARESLLQVPAILLALVLFGLAELERKSTPLMRLLAGAILLHLAYLFWSGGDHMPGARLYLPALGLAGLLIVAALAGAPEDQRPWRTAFCVVLALVTNFTTPAQRTDLATFTGKLVGEHLSRTEKPGTLVALSTAGSIPFHAPQLRFIDMLGLNDYTIARRNPVPFVMHWQHLPGHAKGDGAYVLSRKPDLIILGPSEGTRADAPWFLSDFEIARHPEFERCYKPEQARIPYSAADAGSAPARENPLPMLMYRRHCGA